MLKAFREFVWMALTAVALVNCAGNSAQTQEPVDDSKAPAIPDAPGDAGETAPKAAGVGQAGGASNAPGSSAVSATAAAAPAAPAPAAGERTVIPGALNVRQEPKMDSPVVGKLMKGEKVTVTSCDKYWCKIGDGKFVGAKHLQ